MKRKEIIPVSFKKDHTSMEVGITLSEEVKVGILSFVKVWDVRLVTPYQSKPITSKQMHSLEHIFAYELRNQGMKGLVGVYPMGCKTGFYIVTTSSVSRYGLVEEVYDTLYRVSNAKDYVVPGTKDETQCGNFLYHEVGDLFGRIAMFMKWSAEFLYKEAL